MFGLIRVTAAGVLVLFLILNPVSLPAQPPPSLERSYAQNLFAVCDQAAQAFLNKFRTGLERAEAEGPGSGFDFFQKEQARIEKGFSNPGIELTLIGRWTESRPGRPDVFDQTAMSGFVRSGENSSEALGFFLNPEGQGRHYRYYREVRARESCLVCHGAEAKLSRAVKELIKNRYPDFEGLGFKTGEVLGAVAIKILNPPENRPPSD